MNNNKDERPEERPETDEAAMAADVDKANGPK
jgi:hypothetical protein